MPNACEDGYYLTSFEESPRCKICGHCKDGDICDKMTGLCPNGCQMWFAPQSSCHGYIEGKFTLIEKKTYIFYD